jgi:2-oxo-4-hydroxy-4-carboxy-5-ureidoimidazoline decarboxylase
MEARPMRDDLTVAAPAGDQSSWTLDRLNAAPDDEELRAALRECCAAESWIDRVIAGRPYRDRAALGAASDAATADLDDTGLAEALAGHPRIGERPAAHATWSSQEQAGVSGAADDVRADLAAANAAYETRFGQVYLVCATGKDASELLALCRARLTNDPVTERGVVLGELAKINRIRLHKLLPEGT